MVASPPRRRMDPAPPASGAPHNPWIHVAAPPWSLAALESRGEEQAASHHSSPVRPPVNICTRSNSSPQPPLPDLHGHSPPPHLLFHLHSYSARNTVGRARKEVRRWRRHAVWAGMGLQFPCDDEEGHMSRQCSCAGTSLQFDQGPHLLRFQLVVD